jgi:hypothetical protein
MGHLTAFEVVLVAVCAVYLAFGIYKFIRLIGNGGSNQPATQK